MDDITRQEIEQLMAVYRDQTLAVLDDMSGDILSLQAQWDPDDVEGHAATGESMTRLRRALHTIKGDAACIDLGNTSELAHRLEDVLEAVIAGKLNLDGGVVTIVLHGIDDVRAAISGDTISDVSDSALALLLDEIDLLMASPIEEPVDRQWAVHQCDPHSSIFAFERQAELAPAPGPAPGPADDHAASEEIQAESGKPEGPVEPAPETPKITSARRRAADFVRVEASRIDAILNLAGEMVIARSVMNEVMPSLEELFAGNDALARFSNASAQMGKLIAELQKSVLKMRMVTIDQVFRRFARPMWELAAETGKKIEIETTGGETELDRTLVDLIYEPLLHLLRNAVDHGIESPEERAAAGKPATGKIAMRAYHEGNQVVVEVSDDGRGVDTAALRKKAIHAGIIDAETAADMSEEDAIELVFRSGISTAAEITRISGRGVGGAAIKGVIEELRGSVSVRTSLGQGSTFVLRMPLTLAIIKALLFTVRGQMFALPLLVVKEVARASECDLASFDGFESFRFRSSFVSLVRPAKIFGLDRRRGGKGAALRTTESGTYIVIASIAGKRFGLMADDIVGEQELVIKPLDSEWVQNDALAGASVLGDGQVVLIMDAGSVLRKAVRYENSRAKAGQAASI